MDAFTHRPYAEQTDHHRVDDLFLAYRAATRVDVYPTIWRLRLLMTSRVWEPAHDTHVWEDTTGQMIGFALLWRRRAADTYLVLEQFVHPRYATVALADAILRWAMQRAKTLAGQRALPLTLVVTELDLAEQVHSDLPSYGFIPVQPGPDVYNVYFGQSLQHSFPRLLLPEGYAIRPLQGMDELAEYHALYGFAAVNVEHQRRLLTTDEYRHLVVVDPMGRLIAYCECSIYRKEWHVSDQRIGWIDYIGTRPEHQQQGFGRAILLASLHQLRMWGADTVMLITISTNTPAIRLYQTTGFTRMHIPEPPSYEKRITADA